MKVVIKIETTHDLNIDDLKEYTLMEYIKEYVIDDICEYEVTVEEYKPKEE